MKYEQPVFIIEPGRRTDLHYWRDIWRFRELFFILSWRDILVRYKQTLLGVAWGLIRPLTTIIIFTVVFQRLAGLPSDKNIPYPLMILAALLPWQLFANSFSEAGMSLVSNANLLSKVYFPRIIIPVSSIIVNFVDFIISAFILAFLMAWYGYTPDFHLIALPIFIILTCAAALGTGLWFAALNIRYRDVRYIVPFLIQVGLYVSPVGFSSSLIPDKWRVLYSLNPMASVIDGFRWAILGGGVSVNWLQFSISTLIIFGTCVSGFLFFRHVEKSIVDVM
ncbi:ABC transporter permease [Geomobilimonas luticola]|uniref:Transport permease protein n=1 Tax=Geomobilimonas luticola TaxID=1114878 RepID=A0ABS5SCB6_9BACT|nr:ABC transporter permease [Geomobilimonas luticola]MBT0653019.1 ABC transporter permease [Geomobilimonas luticola]